LLLGLVLLVPDTYTKFSAVGAAMVQVMAAIAWPGMASPIALVSNITIHTTAPANGVAALDAGSVADLICLDKKGFIW